MAAQTANWRVLFDLNIILDVLMRREPYFMDSSRLWMLAETGQIEGLLAAHSITTLFYLYRRQNDRERAYQAIRMLLRIFGVAGVDRTVIAMACDLGWPDFEDAVQATAANAMDCDYLVTRDPSGYPATSLIVSQPSDFLAVWAVRNT